MNKHEDCEGNICPFSQPGGCILLKWAVLPCELIERI